MVAKESGANQAKDDGSGPGRTFYLVLGGLLVVGVAALFMARGGEGDDGAEPTPVSASSVEADPEAGVATGPADAPVTVKEFVDYQCPHCAQFASLTGKMLRRNFARTDSVRWILYDYPLGTFPNSVPAALAARCAGDQGRYWQMEEILFGRQREWGGEGDPTGTFVDFAERIGLDTDAFRSCLEERRPLEEIMASRRYGQQLGVSGTPTLFVNGRKLTTRELSYEALARLIRAAWDSASAAGADSASSG